MTYLKLRSEGEILTTHDEISIVEKTNKQQLMELMLELEFGECVVGVWSWSGEIEGRKEDSEIRTVNLNERKA